MLPKMYDVQPALSPSDIDGLEKRMKIRLPKEYRAWLLKYNGGQPVPGNFSLGLGGNSEGVAWFFAIHEGEFNNFELEYKFWKIMTKRVPGDLVPVATDGSGNLICLSFGSADEGKVYFWDHERETDPPSYANCQVVAESFNDFVNMLGDGSRSS